MSTYKNGLTYGGGLFIDEKYPGERHVHGFQYLGPFTRTDIRMTDDYRPKTGEEPINKLDEIAMLKLKKNIHKTMIKQKR